MNKARIGRQCIRWWLLIMFALALLAWGAWANEDADIVQFGLITDVHAHDLDSPFEGKWMSRTTERMAAFTTEMNAWMPDFVVELGDFINGWVVLGTEPGDPARIPDILAWADSLYGAFDGPRYHVIGNHDVYNLDKVQYREILGLETTSYSFDVGSVHFVVLDVQYADDGTDLAHTYTGVAGFAPEPVLDWLRADLAAVTGRPTLVFVHQTLDDYVEEWGRPLVLNQPVIQEILAASETVIAVFQGHDHANRHTQIEGIHYVTFEAFVDQTTPPTWARITIDTARSEIRIEGVGVQKSYVLTYKPPSN